MSESSVSQPHLQPSVWIAVVAFAISYLFAVYLGAMGLLLPVVGELFRASPAVQGQVFLASFGGSVTGVLLSGTLSDAFGRKQILLGSLVTTFCGLALMGGATAFPLILLGAVLVGGGGAGAQTVSSALLSDLYAERRTLFINGVQVAFGLGAVSAPFLAQALFATPGQWRLFYGILAVAQVITLMVLATLSVPATIPVIRDSSSPRNRFHLLREPYLLILCLSAFLYSGAEVAIFSWMPTYLKTLPGGDTVQGLVVSVFWLPMTIGRICLNLVLRVISLERLRLLLASGAAVASAVTLFLPTPGAILVGVACTGLCFSGVFSVLLADGGNRYPETAGTSLGLIVATSGAGAAVLPWLVGTLQDAGFSWSASLVVVPVAALLIALLALIPLPNKTNGNPKGR
jgi:FHS family glucose/mannose:H+ symporter-like MFS transporter